MPVSHSGPIGTSNLLAAAACYRQAHDAAAESFNQDPTSERTRQLQDAERQVAATLLRMALRWEGAQ